MLLRELRIKRGLLQKDVAKYLGVTTQAYGHYENGRREPDFETLIKLSNYFGITIDMIVRNKPQ